MQTRLSRKGGCVTGLVNKEAKHIKSLNSSIIWSSIRHRGTAVHVINACIRPTLEQNDGAAARSLRETEMIASHEISEDREGPATSSPIRTRDSLSQTSKEKENPSSEQEDESLRVNNEQEYLTEADMIQLENSSPPLLR
jgi:hypothetical protein